MVIPVSVVGAILSMCGLVAWLQYLDYRPWIVVGRDASGRRMTPVSAKSE
jgi:hypothetical protein